MMEFTFDVPAWETYLRGLKMGSSTSAVRFLAMMESEPEEDLEDALEILEEQDILLDISELTPAAATSDTALRLRLEKQLVQEQKLPLGLEENDPLRLYLEEIRNYPQEDTMTKLLPRVVELACGYAGHSVLLLDLIQEGSLGAWQGILAEKQNTDRCILRWLHRAITLQARANGVGQKMRQALEDYRSVDTRLLTELGRNPTLEEIAEGLHITLEEAEVLAQMLDTARTISRAKAETAQPEQTPEDEMAVEDTAYFQMRQRISELLSSLDDEDSQLISLRYGLGGGLPLSPEETGRKLGLTSEEVVAREAAALAKLRTK